MPSRRSAANEWLGRVLRHGRRSSDMSQRQLADAAGVAKSCVARAESGENVSLGLATRLLKTLGYDLVPVDEQGHSLSDIAEDPRRDERGRRFPPHVDLRPMDWWEAQDYQRNRPRTTPPTWTYRSDRKRRDIARAHGCSGTDPEGRPLQDPELPSSWSDHDPDLIETSPVELLCSLGPEIRAGLIDRPVQPQA